MDKEIIDFLFNQQLESFRHLQDAYKMFTNGILKSFSFLCVHLMLQLLEGADMFIAIKCRHWWLFPLFHSCGVSIPIPFDLNFCNTLKML